MPQDAVIIRAWKTGDKSVFAIFPELPADPGGQYCTCYDHIGQHSAGDYLACMNESRPAANDEAAPLIEELRQIGYTPQVIQRATAAHHIARREWSRVA